MKIFNRKFNQKYLSVLLLLCILFTTVSCGTNKAPVNTPGASTETGNSAQEDTSKQEDTQSSEEAYSYVSLSKTMYAKAKVNVRKAPDTNGEKIGSLELGDVVTVTGQCEQTKWYRIKYESGEAYVSNEYLTEEKVEASSWVAKLDAAKNTTQIIVVAGEGTNATVSMHTKDANGVWKENFSTEGRLGKNGLGKEKEGDGKTPIGVYHFTTAFGVLPNPGKGAF